MRALMTTLTERERRHFDQIPDIDPGLIGDRLGAGAQMDVRRYGEHSVIKAPLQAVSPSPVKRLIAGVVGLPSASEAERQFDLYQEYLGPYVVPTKILMDTRRAAFCVVQDLLTNPAAVTPSVLEQNGYLAHQFADIMERARSLHGDTGEFADLMGYEPAQLLQLVLAGRPYMMNVVSAARAEPETNLRIFDFGTYKTRSALGAVLAPFHRLNTKAWGFEFDSAPQRSSPRSSQKPLPPHPPTGA